MEDLLGVPELTIALGVSLAVFLFFLVAGRAMVSSFRFFPFFSSVSIFRMLSSVLSSMSRWVSFSSSVAEDWSVAMVLPRSVFLWVSC